MNTQLLETFDKIDQALIAMAAPGERLDLYHLGRSVLVLHFDLPLSTKDIDIVDDRSSELQKRALELFGKDQSAAERLGMYLDPVPAGLPPLPHDYRTRCQEVEPGRWSVIRLWRLDDHDLAATKLKSFRAQDQQDLKFLCDEGRLLPEVLRERLEKAFWLSLPKDGDPDRERAFTNLKKVVDYLEKGRPF